MRRWLPKSKAARICLVVLFGLLLLIGFMLDFHHVVLGYCKGQPRYKGLPADYWRARIQTRNRFIRHEDEPATRLALELLGQLRMDPTRDYVLAFGDEAATPVLLSLAEDSDDEVRIVAITVLGTIPMGDQAAIAPIIVALDDKNPGIRGASICALDAQSVSDPNSPAVRAAVPRLIRLANEHPFDPEARCILERIHPELRPLSRLPNGRFCHLEMPKN
jgi:hypothetical protein